ncbi:hypothetical protein BDZ89DRAFT_532706 [Hymenopellis radicata]|nr:hypothetical protein BDZ89DRAFT_532706 [Hymenopellis radicata]
MQRCSPLHGRALQERTLQGMNAAPSAGGQHRVPQRTPKFGGGLYPSCQHTVYALPRLRHRSRMMHDASSNHGPTQSQADLEQGFVGPWLGGGLPSRSSLTVHSCKHVISPYYPQKYATVNFIVLVFILTPFSFVRNPFNWCHVGITCWLGFVSCDRSSCLFLPPPQPP